VEKMINRFAALTALVVAFAATVAVLMGSHDSSRGDKSTESSSGSSTNAVATDTTTTNATTQTKTTSSSKSVYVVQPGDLLTTIAESTGVSVDELLELNPDVDPQSLVAGQKLKLKR